LVVTEDVLALLCEMAAKQTGTKVSGFFKEYKTSHVLVFGMHGIVTYKA